MRVKGLPQTLPPPSPSPSRNLAGPSVKVEGEQLLTPSDLGLTDEEWSKGFQDPTSSELDDGSESDVEVVRVPSSLPPPKAGRVVEGVVESDPFTAAHIRNLHGAPELSNEKPKYEAYVVFAGRKPGIYQTWPAAAPQVFGLSTAVWKGYRTLPNARLAYNHSKSNGTGGITLTDPLPPASPATRAMLAGTRPRPVTTPTQPPVVTRGKCGKGKRKERLPSSTATSPSSSISPHYLWSHHQIPPSSDVSGLGTFQRDAQIFIVFRGRRPGVYYGREAALAGLGNPTHPEAYLDVAGDRAHANSMFVNATMDGDVKVL